MDRPAIYRIEVEGVIPRHWLERLGGMRIVAKTADGVALEGWLSDQAALAGVLNTLVELHLPVQEVSRLRKASPGDGGVEKSPEHRGQVEHGDGEERRQR